jgi:hypothetical protein
MSLLLRLIFVMPLFRGILFVILLFLIFLSLMVSISRSDISHRRIVVGKEQET